MTIEEVIIKYVELAELYSSLDSAIKTGSVVEVCKDVMAIDPTADLVIFKEDLYERLMDLSRIIHTL